VRSGRVGSARLCDRTVTRIVTGAAERVGIYAVNAYFRRFGLRPAPTGLVALAGTQAAANRLETAACFGDDDAVYVSDDGTRIWAGPTPSGLYVTERLHLPERLPASDELRVRQARLTAFAEAQHASGYLVGDGAEECR
jgi:hypothetical protein